MQMDGVTLWRATREQYDYNPPLVPYKEVKTPPPLLPELLSSFKLSRQLLTRGALYKEAGENISTGFKLWDAKGIREAYGWRQSVDGCVHSKLFAEAVWRSAKFA